MTKIFLLGGKDEEFTNQSLVKDFNVDRLTYFSTSESLLLFAALIKQLDYIITSDSLSLHLAISQRKYHTSFFTPTSAVEIDDFGYGKKVINHSRDYCSYLPNADNSYLTAEILFNNIINHITTKMGLSINI